MGGDGHRSAPCEVIDAQDFRAGTESAGHLLYVGEDLVEDGTGGWQELGVSDAEGGCRGPEGKRVKERLGHG